jgi:hypothetical protein
MELTLATTSEIIAALPAPTSCTVRTRFALSLYTPQACSICVKFLADPTVSALEQRLSIIGWALVKHVVNNGLLSKSIEIEFYAALRSVYSGA